jgi:hypothetical protein
MVIARKKTRERGWLAAELMFALVVIVVALIPLAYSFRAEQRLVRAHYNQVVAMEIIDGEMELLRAGAWRNLLDGEHPYKVTARAATNLPPGAFFQMRTGSVVRLEWRPIKKGAGGIIQRQFEISE